MLTPVAPFRTPDDGVWATPWRRSAAAVGASGGRVADDNQRKSFKYHLNIEINDFQKS